MVRILGLGMRKEHGTRRPDQSPASTRAASPCSHFGENAAVETETARMPAVGPTVAMIGDRGKLLHSPPRGGMHTNQFAACGYSLDPHQLKIVLNADRRSLCIRQQPWRACGKLRELLDHVDLAIYARVLLGRYGVWTLTTGSYITTMTKESEFF